MSKGLSIVCSLALGCFASVYIAAQTSEAQPLQWRFSSVQSGEGEATLIFTCNMEDGWHIYSQFLEEGGPLPTTFTFVPDRSYSLNGKVQEEGTPVKEFDSVFQMPIVWYNNTAVFTQRVKLNVPVTTVKGKIEFMGCNSYMCLPPDAVNFSLEVSAQNGAKNKGQ